MPAKICTTTSAAGKQALQRGPPRAEAPAHAAPSFSQSGICKPHLSLGQMGSAAQKRLTGPQKLVSTTSCICHRKLKTVGALGPITVAAMSQKTLFL